MARANRAPMVVGPGESSRSPAVPSRGFDRRSGYPAPEVSVGEHAGQPAVGRPPHRSSPVASATSPRVPPVIPVSPFDSRATLRTRVHHGGEPDAACVPELASRVEPGEVLARETPCLVAGDGKRVPHGHLPRRSRPSGRGPGCRPRWSTPTSRWTSACRASVESGLPGQGDDAGAETAYQLEQPHNLVGLSRIGHDQQHVAGRRSCPDRRAGPRPGA